MNSSANDTQVGGAHYRSAIQHWDLVANRGLDYYQGQVTKYVTRWRSKNGIQDLEKSRHFLRKMIELHQQGLLPISLPSLLSKQSPISMELYARSNQLTREETSICSLIVDWQRKITLLWEALDQLNKLIAAAEASKAGVPFGKPA